MEQIRFLALVFVWGIGEQSHIQQFYSKINLVETRRKKCVRSV